MKRFVFTFAATAALAAFAPAAALAHHHHHGHHFGARHARFERFGDLSGQQTSSPSNAGTVASFSGGVLTIQLTDGSTVSGTVTNDTRIECSSSSQSQGEDDQGDDDQSQSSGSQTSGEDGQSSQTSGDDDQSSGDDGQGDSSSSCSSSNLTPGTAVRAAELRLSGDGKTWEKVELGS